MKRLGQIKENLLLTFIMFSLRMLISKHSFDHILFITIFCFLLRLIYVCFCMDNNRIFNAIKTCLMAAGN